MAGMLTLRCSLPKGEWHAERRECLATPVPEVPLAKLNVLFCFFFVCVFWSIVEVYRTGFRRSDAAPAGTGIPVMHAWKTGLCSLQEALNHSCAWCHNTVLSLEVLTCCGRCHPNLILVCHDKIGMTCWSVQVLQKEIPLTIFAHNMDPDEVYTEH